MEREFFDPPWEAANVVLIEAATIRKAQQQVLACEACDPEAAELPFDNVLDAVTGNDPAITDYLMTEAAKCPRCKRDITEKTLVDWGRE